MEKKELKDYIDYIQEIQSETEDIEVKAAHKGCPKRLYDTLSSFSNRAGGGVIIFGLDENKNFEVVGVYDPNDLQKRVVSQCNNMVPKIRPYFTILKYGELNVVSAEISEVSSEEKPCYYSSKGIQNGSYIRVGDADEPMTSYEIYNLTAYKVRIEEDIREISKSTLDDLNSEKLKSYLKLIKKQKLNLSKFQDEYILERLSIIKRINDKYIPTLTGLLCFGICPELILPQLIITATVSPGFEIGETGELGERFVDNKKIEGTIPEMIKLAVEFVTRNMKKRTIIRDDTGERDDKLEYPIRAIREAIINSLIHRDYSSYTESQYVSIRMFNDRMEITNPGGLYGDLTIDKIFNVINPPVRNKNLIRMLEDLDELENRSSGIATMVTEMRKLRLEPPEFQDLRGNFKVTFKNHNLMTKDDQEWLHSLNIPLNENEAYALVYLRKNFKITNGDYQTINNVNRDKALVELKNLISKGLIDSKGVGSGTYYILLEKFKKSEIRNMKNDLFNKTEQDTQQDKPSKLTDQDKPIKITDQDKEKSNMNIQKILKYCETPRSKKEIMNYIGLSHRVHFEKRYLYPLMKKGKIKMTIPDKPTSRNQKYIRVKGYQ